MAAAVDLHTTAETWTETRQWRWGRSELSSHGIHELKSEMRSTNTKITNWESWGREEVLLSETLAIWQRDYSSTCRHLSSLLCKSSPERQSAESPGISTFRPPCCNFSGLTPLYSQPRLPEWINSSSSQSYISFWPEAFIQSFIIQEYSLLLCLALSYLFIQLSFKWPTNREPSQTLNHTNIVSSSDIS